MPLLHGSALLSDYLSRNDLTVRDFAEDLEVARQQVYRWIDRTTVPGPAMRWCVDRATGGFVPESSWLTDEERTKIGRIPEAARSATRFLGKRLGAIRGR